VPLVWRQEQQQVLIDHHHFEEQFQAFPVHFPTFPTSEEIYFLLALFMV
jgi:nanoRNase/pAp phosphatase (c-di-AMP/oligoRNAs hydrolase)